MPFEASPPVPLSLTGEGGAHTKGSCRKGGLLLARLAVNRPPSPVRERGTGGEASEGSPVRSPRRRRAWPYEIFYPSRRMKPFAALLCVSLALAACASGGGPSASGALAGRLEPYFHRHDVTIAVAYRNLGTGA